MNLVTFYSKEYNPEQVFEVVVHSPENLSEVKQELREKQFILSEAIALGHFAVKVETSQWPLLNTVIQGNIVVSNAKQD